MPRWFQRVFDVGRYSGEAEDEAIHLDAGGSDRADLEGEPFTDGRVRGLDQVPSPVDVQPAGRPIQDVLEVSEQDLVVDADGALRGY